MDEVTRKFLAKNMIPPHICVLMEFYGVSFVHDLYEFGEDDVKGIEASVREGTIGGQTDLNDASNLLKFLGSSQADYKHWSFRPIDKKKLLKLSDLAKKTLGEEIEQKAPATEKAKPVRRASPKKENEVVWLGSDAAAKIKRSSRERPSSELDGSYTNFGASAGIVKTILIEDSPSPIKRNRKGGWKTKERSSSEIAYKAKLCTDRVIKAVNAILNKEEIRNMPMKSADQIDETYVEAFYDNTTKSFNISAQCVFCDKQIALSRIHFSISGRNYGLHLMRKHPAPL